MTTIAPTPAICGTLAEFINAGNVRAQDFATKVRAALIQAAGDNGFSKAAQSSLPKYRVGDSVTARMWLRDAGVWLYNLSAPERQWLLKQEFIWS